MRKTWLFFFALTLLAGPIWADFADEDAARQRAAEQRRRENARKQDMVDSLIDGGWQETPSLHISAYGMFGSGGAGGGLGMDWQPHRNFAWTFMDVNYYAGSFNVSTLATAIWRPFFLELSAFAGPGLGLRVVSNGPPENAGDSYSYSTEKTELSFLLVYGASIGFHLGPGSLFANVVFSEAHRGAFSVGYKYGGVF